jgi:hypothetical protein
LPARLPVRNANQSDPYGGGAFSGTSSNWRANQNKIAHSYIIEIAYDFSR